MQVSDALLDYVQALIDHTRHSPRFAQGLSPRAGVAILRAAQAWAHDGGPPARCCPRTCRPSCPSVVGHRLHGSADAAKGGFDAAAGADRGRADSLSVAAAPRVPSRSRARRPEAVHLRLDLPGERPRGAAGHARPAAHLHPAHAPGLRVRASRCCCCCSPRSTTRCRSASCSPSCSASMAGVAMLHTWRNLAHLQAAPGALRPGVRRARPRTSA